MRLGADGELARALGGDQNELETVLHVFETIFYRDTCHDILNCD